MNINERFGGLEMEQIKMPNNIISQEVGKVVKSAKNILQFNSPTEVIDLDKELALELGVLDKLQNFLNKLNSANDENYYQALAA